MEIQSADGLYPWNLNSAHIYAELKTPNDDNKVSEVDNTNPVEEIHESAASLLIDVKV